MEKIKPAKAIPTKTIWKEPQNQSKGQSSTNKCRKCGSELKKIYDFKKEQMVYPNICLVCKRKQEEESFLDQLERSKKRIQQQKIENQFQKELGSRFKERSFDNFVVDETNMSAYKRSKDFANNFAQVMNQGFGLMIVGDYGTGKTHLAAAILKEVISKDYTGGFVSVPDLISKIRDSWDSEESEKSLMRSLKTADLVVLDDIGAENTKDWVRERLFVLINARYENKLPTVMTTNCTWKELGQKLGQRIESRLSEMTKLATLEGDDYRKFKG